MTSYFQLELDTTPPVLEILSPNNASSREKTRIRVQADEELSTYQDIYMEDSYGNKTKIPFTHFGDYFETDIVLNADNQLITIVAQLKDVVDNLSAVTKKTIRLIDGKPLYIVMQELIRDINNKELQRSVSTKEFERKLIEDIKLASHQTNERVRTVETNIPDSQARNPYHN